MVAGTVPGPSPARKEGPMRLSRNIVGKKHVSRKVGVKKVATATRKGTASKLGAKKGKSHKG